MDVSKALEQVKVHLSKHSDNKYQNSIINTESSLRVKEFTLLTAVKYITRYVSKKGEKLGNPEDLMKAIHFILFELENRIGQEEAITIKKEFEEFTANAKDIKAEFEDRYNKVQRNKPTVIIETIYSYNNGNEKP